MTDGGRDVTQAAQNDGFVILHYGWIDEHQHLEISAKITVVLERKHAGDLALLEKWSCASLRDRRREPLAACGRIVLMHGKLLPATAWPVLRGPCTLIGFHL